MQRPKTYWLLVIFFCWATMKSAGSLFREAHGLDARPEALAFATSPGGALTLVIGYTAFYLLVLAGLRLVAADMRVGGSGTENAGRAAPG